jgi:hypothetical protein
MSHLFNKAAVGISLLVALLLAAVLWGSSVTEAGVERAVRQNFVAAGMLSRLQVEGEKLRRYEKEMFIYVSDAGKRNGYVKEHDAAYTKMLGLLDTMLLPSGTYFTDEERKQILDWKAAAVFYSNEMAALARRAEALQTQAMTPEQRIGLTVQFNDAIKAGKDRFRELLVGTDKMRTAKEEAAQQIAVDIDATFQRLRIGVLIGGLLVIGLILAALRGEPAVAASRKLTSAA